LSLCIHLLSALGIALIHNQIYGVYNFFFDANLSFFGFMVLMYGLFNYTFLTGYFKTGYHFGKPLIIAVILTLIYAFVIEYSIARYQIIKDLFESDLTSQVLPFIITFSLGVVLSILAVKKSQKNYQSIDL
jgi:ABC-2 type transport system permease protein